MKPNGNTLSRVPEFNRVPRSLSFYSIRVRAALELCRRSAITLSNWTSARFDRRVLPWLRALADLEETWLRTASTKKSTGLLRCSLAGTLPQVLRQTCDQLTAAGC